MTEHRRGGWIQTFTGRKFWPLDPHAEDVHIIDIAHPLAMKVRFNGHVSRFYSVAQHSVLVAEQQEQPCDQLAALLHDAAEAYLPDVPSPIKRSAEFSQFRGIEKAVEFAIGKALGLDQLVIHKPAVKQADLVALSTEARDLMRITPNHESVAWHEQEPLPEPIMPWAPTLARENFLRLYARLTEVEGACGLCRGDGEVLAGPGAFDPYLLVSNPCEGCGGSGRVAT